MHALTTAVRDTKRPSSSLWGRAGFARRMEHALFTVTLAAIGYLALSPWVGAVWI